MPISDKVDKARYFLIIKKSYQQEDTLILNLNGPNNKA